MGRSQRYPDRGPASPLKGKPLVEAVAQTLDPIHPYSPNALLGVGANRIAEVAGVNVRTVYRWWHDMHNVRPRTADAVCCNINVHPSEVYGEEWWTV
jgi:hypothetical protein